VADCRDLGLVDMVAEQQGNALDAARSFAADLVNNAPLSIAGAKLVLEAVAAGKADLRAQEIDEVIARAMDSADYREGSAAFGEKRPPHFVGR
jgi:enoyl-CoA hydratase/carnithine racemase